MLTVLFFIASIGGIIGSIIMLQNDMVVIPLLLFGAAILWGWYAIKSTKEWIRKQSAKKGILGWISAKMEAREAEERKYIEYISYGNIRVLKCDSNNISLFSKKPVPVGSNQYHPATATYTGVSGGGISVGEWNVTKAHYTSSVGISDRYRVQCKWKVGSDRIELDTIALSAQDAERAKHNTYLAKLLRGNTLYLTREASRANTAVAGTVLRMSGDINLAQNVIMKGNANRYLTKEEADAVISFVCSNAKMEESYIEEDTLSQEAPDNESKTKAKSSRKLPSKCVYYDSRHICRCNYSKYYQTYCHSTKGCACYMEKEQPADEDIKTEEKNADPVSGKKEGTITSTAEVIIDNNKEQVTADKLPDVKSKEEANNSQPKKSAESSQQPAKKKISAPKPKQAPSSAVLCEHYNAKNKTCTLSYAPYFNSDCYYSSNYTNCQFNKKASPLKEKPKKPRRNDGLDIFRDEISKMDKLDAIAYLNDCLAEDKINDEQYSCLYDEISS